MTILKHPHMTLRFFLQADASSHGIGACLFQLNPDNGERNIIAFTSRTLQSAELSYTVTEKELLAVVYALQQWRILVLGRPLTIVSDHKALCFIKNCRLLNSRLTRWILYIQEFDFEWEYCKGQDNIIADTLSRFPLRSLDADTPNSKTIHLTEIKNQFSKVMDGFFANPTKSRQ